MKTTTTVRPRGRPFKGNLKVTLRLSPAIVAALSEASRQLALNKSELTERALQHYLRPQARSS